MAYPLFFGGYYYDTAFSIGIIIQQFCLFLCVLSFICAPDNRKSSALLLMGAYSLYAVIMDVLFNEVVAWFYLLESLSFFAWSITIMTRYERKTLPDINHNNIILAFYKGEKGSFIMRFFELFGISVKSMCIIAGDKCLVLKSNKDGFEFGCNKGLLKKQDNYFMIDTGKKATPEFIEKMKSKKNKPAKLFGLRIRCIEGISDLLEDIGEEFKPTNILDNIPSLYLKKVA